MDDLRMLVKTAKRVLTKEKIDRQMSRESSTTPFMKLSNSHKSSFKDSKKVVTFDALETIERNSGSIDKLTSLVSKMNTKMDKHEIQDKPQVYQGRRQGQNRHDNRQNNYHPKIDHTVEIGTLLIETEETMKETIDYRGRSRDNCRQDDR